MGMQNMTRPEEALAIHRTMYGHGSTFLPLEDGRLLQACIGTLCFSEDGGLTWSGPVGEDVRGRGNKPMLSTHRDAEGLPIGGTECSLVKLSGRNSIGLAARVNEQGANLGAPYAVDPQDMYFLFWRSDDAGETWSSPVRMTAPGVGTAGLQDTFLRTAGGRIILPVFHHLGQTLPWQRQREPMSGRLVNDGQWIGTAGHFFDPHFGSVYVVYSDDEGRTWQRNTDGDLTILLDWNGLYSYVNETSITEAAPGRLLLMMRNGLGRLFQAWSDDNGETWTRPQLTLLASSTCPAQIRTLPNGHLLCVWNQETEDEIHRGLIRCRVSCAISRNGGGVWEFFQNLISYNEMRRVEPGPIRPARPMETYYPAGQPASERPSACIDSSSFAWRASYPSVRVLDDRVIVTHTYTSYDEHPTQATMVSSTTRDGYNQLQKVLPLSWFYGGREPDENPFLKTAYEPAKPAG